MGFGQRARQHRRRTGEDSNAALTDVKSTHFHRANRGKMSECQQPWEPVLAADYTATAAAAALAPENIYFNCIPALADGVGSSLSLEILI